MIRWLAPHAAFIALLAAATPLAIAFAWQHGVATLGDDSVSYLVLARHFVPGGDALSDPWVAGPAHFPPLFPLALAAFGGAHDLLVAHLVVAAFALAALVALYRYATHELGDARLGFAVALVFMLTPDAWISIKGILSEPLYLLLSLCALHYHATRLQGRAAPVRDWLVFGVLLACCYLARAAAIALVAAYAVHVLVRIVMRRQRPAAPMLAACASFALIVGAWLAWRPSGASDAYRETARQLLAAWCTEPRETFGVALRQFADGWVAVFMASGTVGRIAYGLLSLLGLAALAGAARRAMANRLDGWYTLAAVAMTFFWTMDADNTRRLLYPLVPLALLQALDLALAGSRRLAPHRAAALLPAVVLAVPVLLALPALVLVAQRSLDRAPIAAHSGQSLADNLAYYVVIDRARARAEAAQDVAVLDGLAALATRTPPGSRVMWMRPEYVAVLGAREGVPFYFDWDGPRIAREIRAARVDYVILSRAYKTDLDVRNGDASASLRDVPLYAHQVLTVRNAVSGAIEFTLMQVDPAALSRYLALPGRAG